MPHSDSGRPPAWVRLTGTVSTCWEPAGGALIHAGSMQNSAHSLELIHGIACRGRVSRRRHVLDVGLLRAGSDSPPQGIGPGRYNGSSPGLVRCRSWIAVRCASNAG